MDQDRAKKEAALEEKMKLIRKKNEERLKRLKEIEEDRANADVYSDQVAHKSPRNQMAGVRKESPPATKQFQRGRGRLLSKMSQETLRAKQLEEKRKENIKREEEELKRKSVDQRPASSYLADDRRVDMGKSTRRSPHSYGGTHFDSAVTRMGRERGNFKHWGNNPEMCMTGKERLQYREWKEEREKIDASRKERHKKGEQWSREWDQTKEWDGKKGMWLDSNSGRARRRNEPPRISAEDSWGEDTFEKVWDGKNRRWVDPKEAVSFGDNEGQEEDWGNAKQQEKKPSSEGGRTERYSSSSEGSGGDGRSQKSPQQHYAGRESCEKPQQSESIKFADDLRHKIKGPKETQHPVAEGDAQDVSNEGTADLVEGSSAEGESKEDAPADAKPQRVKVRRQRGSVGKKTEAEDKESQTKEKGDGTQKGEEDSDDEGLGLQVNRTDSAADDTFFQDQSAQECQGGDEVKKTQEDDNSNNAQLGHAAERTEENRQPEQRKESIDFVPISPLDKEGVPLEWGDVEIDEEQLVLDTAEIRMVTY